MNKKYANGYLPKIQYWAEVLYNACQNNDRTKIAYAKAKLDYFYTREERALIIDELIENHSN